MDVAKVARDYFLSSQSSLLIPNREYGSRKLIHVGLGRSNSAGNILKHNNNSNVNKNHHREDRGDGSGSSSKYYSNARIKRASFLSNSRARVKSLPGTPEETGTEAPQEEYPWRTTGSGNTAESPPSQQDPRDHHQDYNNYTSFSSSSSSSSSSFSPSSSASPKPYSSPRAVEVPEYAAVSKNTASRTRPASLSALPASASLSTSSLSPRPRPTSTSSSSSSSGGGGGGGGLGTLKGLLGAGSSGGPGIREKALAMRSVSLDSADMDIDRMDFRTPSSKTWQHPPDALLTGHILYTVKFLGECVVEKPKGTDVVKEAIRKMKFNKHIKRAEGQKPPKVDLIISAEAVCILDPKTRAMMYRYPLHLISYCADDKSDKRMITFIAKETNGNRHFCYVFDSEKCAEEITLTIGQAFDLAYKKFLESHSNEGDLKKQYIVLQKRVNALAFENQTLKQRIAELERLKDRSDVDNYKRANQINDLSAVSLSLRESSTDDDDSTFSSSDHQPSAGKAVVGRRLENLLPLDEASSPSNGAASRHTNGAHAQTPESAAMPILSPPPPNTRSHRANSLRSQTAGTPGTPGTPNTSNPFYASPPNSAQASAQVDPFGMQAFSPANVGGNSEQELMDIRDGFSRGLTFGTDDFNLDDLDPLNQKL